MDTKILIETVSRLMTSPKGILAIDESIPTCNKRFEKLGIVPSEENRRVYRELLVTAPNIEQYISGYILFDETIRQKTTSGKSFVSVLREKGIDIGIKVDMGTKDLLPYFGDKVTEGLVGLVERLQEYKKMDATFAKWRAIYTIDKETPSEACMQENADIFAEYAHICQSAGIVPIVEPEILIDGNHTIEQCFAITARNLDIIFKTLTRKNIFIPGIILKTSMIISGKEAVTQSGADNIAEMTIQCLKEHVPKEIGGIVFLSGGQGDDEATQNLSAMHKYQPLPWSLTFSYGRAIQNKALISWAKNSSDVFTAQELLLAAAKANSLARIGEY
ncbi:MAG: class I fructose-bisphosphate aldolase [bacterium]